MFVSYAQNGEDVWLQRVFEGKNDGFYIDVGAHHPVTDSVTKAFYDRGWNGVNIEPLPNLHEAFVKERQRDINLLCACGRQTGTQILHVPPVGQQGVATLDTNTAAYAATFLDNAQQLPVTVRTLTEICSEYARMEIDFLKTGVEGFEGEVLAGMDFNTFRPVVIIVEAVQPLRVMKDPVADAASGIWHSWEPLLMDAGYVFATFDGINRYYVRKEDQHLVSKFIIPISNIVDEFSKFCPIEVKNSSYCIKEKPSIKALSRQAAQFQYNYRNQSIPAAPSKVLLTSKASTQADIDSPWCCYWTNKLKMQRIYHRKIWEQAYVPQALFNADMLQPGKKGIVFGCGREPLPALFASMGCSIVATDAPPEIGWKGSSMYADSLENLYFPNIVERKTFERSVSLQYVDMNNIPEELNGSFDFCWSICALEHLGSLQAGLDFVMNSLKVLKNSGLAVHTTEFNYANSEHTFESAGNSLYMRSHFDHLIKQLRNNGNHISEPNFDVGCDIFDLYVDTPPYDSDGYEQGGPHLKLDISGFASTCFGIIITRG